MGAFIVAEGVGQVYAGGTVALDDVSVEIDIGFSWAPMRGVPAELVARAAGRVIEVSVPEAAEAKLADRMELVARRSVRGEVVPRGVLREGDVPVEARIAKDITLEEAYLAFMVGRGRSIDELDAADAA